jgi:hypothetical protein
MKIAERINKSVLISASEITEKHYQDPNSKLILRERESWLLWKPKIDVIFVSKIPLHTARTTLVRCTLEETADSIFVMTMT